jgi:hypothetical protein
MNRITPEMVKEAYEKTGLKPMAKTWADWEGDRKCGCALTACYYAKVENPTEFNKYIEKVDEDIIEPFLSDKLGLDEEYIIGFIRGFDNSTSPTPLYARDYNARKIGYEDGQAARKAVFGEG